MDYLYRINRVGKYCRSLEFWPILLFLLFLFSFGDLRMSNAQWAFFHSPSAGTNSYGTYGSDLKGVLLLYALSLLVLAYKHPATENGSRIKALKGFPCRLAFSSGRRLPMFGLAGCVRPVQANLVDP